MSESNFNLGRWVRRLGFKREVEPEIIYAAQPVMVVSDQTGLTPHYQGPGLIIGGTSPQIALEHSVFDFQSRSEGGTLFHAVAATGALHFGITSAPPTYGTLGPVALNRNSVTQPDPVLTGDTGTVTAANRQFPGDPFATATFGVAPTFGPVFVRSGFHLVVEMTGANLAGFAWALIEELPAPRGA